MSIPIGCIVNGTNSFIGETLNNYAGGALYNGSLSLGAGVMAGWKNESCDNYSAIGAGNANIIGGDGTSQSAMIGAGSRNYIEGALDGFIGAGETNLLGTVPGVALGIGNHSGIVSGINNTIASEDSFIGAGSSNSIFATDVVHYAQASVIGGGENNNISGPYSGIGAGTANNITSAYSIIAGGTANQDYGFASAIGGGQNNLAEAQASTIGGGQANTAAGQVGTIGGGQGNTASGQAATVGGGQTNTASGAYGMLGGGYNNNVSGVQATVAGGYGNLASGRNAVIPGGAYNVAAGLDSFAAGNASHAAHDGTFVWSDYSASSGITATGTNQFLARAAGGFYLFSSANARSGVRLAPGSGSWSNLSDRAAKTWIVNVDSARILAKVAALPITEWSYVAQANSVRHVGPMAQDFRAAFGLGEDDRHISTVDEDGIALAAIKALQAEVNVKDRELVAVRIREASLDAKYARLEQRLRTLEAHLTRSQ